MKSPLFLNAQHHQNKQANVFIPKVIEINSRHQSLTYSKKFSLPQSPAICHIRPNPPKEIRPWRKDQERMMISWHGNVFYIADYLWGESCCHSEKGCCETARLLNKLQRRDAVMHMFSGICFGIDLKSYSACVICLNIKQLSIFKNGYLFTQHRTQLTRNFSALWASFLQNVVMRSTITASVVHWLHIDLTNLDWNVFKGKSTFV